MRVRKWRCMSIFGENVNLGRTDLSLSQSQHRVQRTHIYDIVCAFIIVGSQHHNAMLHTTTYTEITTGSFLEHELTLPDFLSLSLHTDAGLHHLMRTHTHTLHTINQYILIALLCRHASVQEVINLYVVFNILDVGCAHPASHNCTRLSMPWGGQFYIALIDSRQPPSNFQLSLECLSCRS